MAASGCVWVVVLRKSACGVHQVTEYNQPSSCTRARRRRRKRSAAPSRMPRMASAKRGATSDEVDTTKT